MRSIAILLLIVLMSFSAYGQMASARLSTSFYGWQGRSDSLVKQTYVRAYENVNLDVAGKNFSFTSNFMASKDFSTSIETDPEVRFSTLAFKARNLYDMLGFTLGRQFIANGPAVGFIDGGSLSLKFLDGKIAFNGYGGFNVSETRTVNFKKNFSDNSMMGAYIKYDFMEGGTVGAAYMNRTRTPEPFKITWVDSIANPNAVTLTKEIQLLGTEEAVATIDLDLTMIENVALYSRFDADMQTGKITRAELYTRATLLPSLNISAEYLMREPRIDYNSLFSVFTQNSLQEIEGGIEYQVTSDIRTFARYGHVLYAEDESSGRLNIGGIYDIISVSYTQNFGYAGELNGVNVQTTYPMMEKTFIPSLGVGYASYKLSKNEDSKNNLYLNAGATYRPMQSLSASATFQWMKNSLYSSDARVFFTLNYWFSQRLNLF
jgi:hypothetical protein